MKKKSSTIVLIIGIILIVSSITFIGIYFAVVPSDEKIIQEAKNELIKTLSMEKVYDDINLKHYLTVKNKQLHIVYSSMDESLINSTNGHVNRNLTENHCSLTATITYKSKQDTITFNYILPPKKYTNYNPQFSYSGTGLQFDIIYLAYDDDNNLTLKLDFFNNFYSNITGIQKLNFSLSDGEFGKYLLRDYTYTNYSTNQFECSYHQSVTITMLISHNILSSECELSTFTPYLTINDIEIY